MPAFGVVRDFLYRSSGIRLSSKPCCMANRVAVERFDAPDLGVDPLNMGLRSLRRDAQATADLPGGRAAGDQGEYLDLTRGEPGGPGPPLPALLAGGGEHGVHRVSLQAARPHLPPQHVRGQLRRRAGRCGRGSLMAWQASAAARIRPVAGIADPDSPR